MGMKNTTKGRDIVRRSRPTDAELGKIDSNNGDAGKIISGLTAGKRVIEYEARDIALSDIRLNPDNEIFREADTNDDIVQLADDIQRNGLMHNIVVYPKKENGATVYILLSGERRYKAMVYLEKQGDASWNILKNCNVITTELSANEKKVLLYSANLQVRGGFSDAEIRRRAVTEFIACLQKEPYNMSVEDAKKAIKEISPANARTVNKDLRIEEKLDEGLKSLLDSKFLSRSECEVYLRYDAQKQKTLFERFDELSRVDCYSSSEENAGKNYIEVLRDDIHDRFREDINDALKQETRKGIEDAFAAAVEQFNEDIGVLKEKSKEYGIAKATSEQAAAEIEHTGRKEAAAERAANEERKATTKRSTIQKSVPKVVEKLRKSFENKKFKKSIQMQSIESRQADIASLNEIIELAEKMKKAIEDSVEAQ